MKGILMRFLATAMRAATGVLAGLLGLVVIIWFGGRFVGLVSVESRLIAIGVLFGLYGLWLLGRFFYLRLRGRKLASDLAEQVDDDQLKEKLESVLTSLKATNLGQRYRGKGALYALPWYMIIGPSAAGKSTFFSRSGLNFPFKDDEKNHVAGVGGTKNCDWWFADEAVLIDTAGRYTTEESSHEWLHFLRLLKRNRPKVPVNGVILALPIDELLTGDTEALKLHAQNARNRLHEVMTELGLMVPVYIVLTKCDLVRGFEAFFEDLSDTESSQPWGVYVLDQTEDRNVDVTEVFAEKLSALTQRLLDQRTQKMMLAQTAAQRADIFQYPSQFSGVSDRLLEFVSLLFKDSPYHDKPWFAGIYFTSSVQEGAVIERRNNLLKDIFSKALGFTYRAEGRQRSYFIKEFFTQVIFPLKSAVRGNRKRERFHLAAKSLSLLVLSGLAGILGLTLAGTYTANLALLSDYEEKAQQFVTTLSREDLSENEQLKALTGLYYHYGDLETIQTYSPLQLLSRYDLIGTHGEPMRELLVDAIASHLESKVAQQFQQSLTLQVSEWPNLSDAEQSDRRLSYYQHLRVYQMMTIAPDRYERDEVAQFIAKAWANDFDESTTTMTFETHGRLLTSLVGLYLQHRFESITDDAQNPWSAGAQVVTQAQQQLMTPPDADHLYRQLVATASGQFNEVTLKGLLGSASVRSLSGGDAFPGVFTVAGWHQFAKDEIDRLSSTASQGDWVLGMDRVAATEEDTQALADGLRLQMRNLYFEEYVQHWSQLLRTVRVANNNALADRISAVKAIADSEGLAVKLFDEIDANLQITEVALSGEAPSGEALTDVAPIQPPLIPMFAKKSEALRAIFDDKDDTGRSDLLEAYLTEVRALVEELDTIRVASDVDLEARKYAAGVLSGNYNNRALYGAWINVDNLLNDQPDTTRRMVSSMMTSPLRVVWSGMIDASERSLQAQWAESVYRVYNSGLRGRFPFNESGSDATVRDVNLFLKPKDGVLWQFVENELKPFVQVRSGNWKVRSWLGEGLSFDSALFNGVNSANRVVNGLFDDNDQVSMRYWVSPVPSQGVSESLLEVDNHSYRYRNEPEEWREFQWHLEASQFAQVQIYLNGGAGFADLSYEGPWAFLKLLRQSEIQHSAGTQFNVAFPLKLSDGRTVRSQYRVRADRTGSVLNRSTLQNFALPRQLFKG